MDLFEAKSDRGLERRVDEADLRNLYRAGFLHLDSPVRRSGSPNWFRIEEMFPDFEKIVSAKKYSANLRRRSRNGFLKGALLIFLILAAIALFIFLSDRV